VRFADGEGYALVVAQHEAARWNKLMPKLCAKQPRQRRR